MAELEKLGIAGPNNLREILASSEDPIQAIRDFQDTNGIQLSSLQPALRLLDLQGVSRREFHQLVLEDLQNMLVTVVAQLKESPTSQANAKILDLLTKSFPLVNNVFIRPVVISALRSLGEVPSSYLKQIRSDPDLYRDVPVEVRQQIWDFDQPLFLQEVHPLLSEYVAMKEAEFSNIENVGPVFYTESTPKSRRQNAIVQSIVRMIGKNVKLYDRVLQTLRLKFLESKGSPHYCTLRAELLMLLHDGDVQNLISADPCHKFAWCLDACIRERCLDPKHAKELQAELESVQKKKAEILGDFAIVACDPHALHFFALLAIRLLQQCVTNESLPRDNSGFPLVLRVLQLGLAAYNMLAGSNYKDERIDTIFFTKFLPSLAQLLLDDQARQLAERAASIGDDPSKVCEGFDPAECIGALPDTISLFVKSDPLSALLLNYVAIDAAQRKDRIGVSRILPTLLHVAQDLAFTPICLYGLVSSVCQHLTEALFTEEFCVTFIDNFLLADRPAILNSSERRSEFERMQLLRLVHHGCAHGLALMRCHAILTQCGVDFEETPALKTAYIAVTEKVEQAVAAEARMNEEPPPIMSAFSMEAFDMPVPTPMSA